MGTALAIATSLPAALPDLSDFDLREMRVFSRIPNYHHGVVAVRGLVAVYDTDSLPREGVIDGAYYVVENQHPPALMAYERWLKRELREEHCGHRAQPFSPLVTKRYIVQATRCTRNAGDWWLKMESRFEDGPHEDWRIGHNFVGKVVGIYLPSTGRVS